MRMSKYTEKLIKVYSGLEITNLTIPIPLLTRFGETRT